MPVVSVLTAWDGRGPDLLASASASLAHALLPATWSLEWLLVLDGDGAVPTGLSMEPHLLRTHPRARGVAAARTLAATAARGDLLHVLDADDELPPGALKALIDGLQEEPTAAWATGARWDVVDTAGAVLEARTSPLSPGLVKTGEVSAFRRLHGRCPFPPAQLLLRREALWAAGGWPALAIEEDTALLLALDALSPGVLVDDVCLRSRRHHDQGTADLAGLTASFAAAETWLQARGLA